jgi:hypothetical protein
MHLVDEAVSGRVGSEAMLAKLSEALFVDTLRRYVDALPEQQNGWLAGAQSGLQPRVQTGVWAASRPIPERSQAFAPAHTCDWMSNAWVRAARLFTRCARCWEPCIFALAIQDEVARYSVIFDSVVFGLVGGRWVS